MQKNFDRATQIFLPVFTILGFLFTAMKMPELGLLFNLSGQIFWLYSGYQAWKRADQLGIFITSIVIAIILIAGVINYWFL